MAYININMDTEKHILNLPRLEKWSFRIFTLKYDNVGYPCEIEFDAVYMLNLSRLTSLQLPLVTRVSNVNDVKNCLRGPHGKNMSSPPKLQLRLETQMVVWNRSVYLCSYVMAFPLLLYQKRHSQILALNAVQ